MGAPLPAEAAELGSSGMWCLRMWGLSILVYWPSKTEGVGTSHRSSKADTGEGFKTSILKRHILKHHIPEHPTSSTVEPGCSRRRCRMWTGMKGWPNTVWKLIEIVWLKPNLSRASIYWYMHEQQRRTVSSNLRSPTVLYQQYSANLSWYALRSAVRDMAWHEVHDAEEDMWVSHLSLSPHAQCQTCQAKLFSDVTAM